MEIQYYRIFLGMALLVIAGPGWIYAHGVEGDIHEEKVFVVQAQYDDGEPMNYAKVSVAAPGAELPFQLGRTDKNGRFCFLPDATGEWKVLVSDGMGHALELRVTVGGVATPQAGAAGENQKGIMALPRYQKAMLGICVLFGIFGAWALFRPRRP